MKIDKILDFLFRSRLGHIALLGGTMAGTLLFGGCMCTDLISCACESCGCDCLSDCWSGCNDEIDDCFGGGCGDDCALAGCLFGDGCTTECGDCVIDCGGCNRTICTECDSGCESDNGKGGCDFSCFNCVTTCGGYTEEDKRYIEIHFVDANTGAEIPLYGQGASTYGEDWYWYDEAGDYKKVPVSRSVSTTDNYGYGSSTTVSYYDTSLYDFDGYFFDKDFTQRATDAEGKWVSDKDVSDLKDIKEKERYKVIYGKLAEKNYGETRSFVFTFVDDNGNSLDDQLELSAFNVNVGQQVDTFPTAPAAPVGLEFYRWTFKDGTDFTAPSGIFHLKDWQGHFSAEDNTLIEVVGHYTRQAISFRLKTYDMSEPAVRVFYYGDTWGDYLEDAGNQFQIDYEDEYGKLVGWSRSSDTLWNETNRFVSKTEPLMENDTLYAVYRRKFTITLHNTNQETGARTWTETAWEGETYTPEPLENQGRFKFRGWYDAPEEEGGSSVQQVQVGGNTDLYARWNELTEFTIKYYNYTPKNGVDDWEYWYETTYHYSANSTTPLEAEAQEITGYTFVGWCTMSSDGHLQLPAMKQLPVGAQGDYDLYAKYDRETVTVRLLPSPGSLSSGENVQAVPYGSSDFSLPVPTYTGNTFKGWYTTGSNSVQVTDGQGKAVIAFTTENLGAFSNNTVQLRAVWEASRYTLRFRAEGQAQDQTIEVEHGQAPNETPTEPSKKGHNFAGWYYNGTQQYDPSAEVYEDRTYEAKFTPKTYTVTLDAGDGSFGNGQSTKTVEITWGTTPTLDTPANTPEGKVFLGWSYKGETLAYEDGVLTSAWDIDEENVTLEAVWG